MIFLTSVFIRLLASIVGYCMPAGTLFNGQAGHVNEMKMVICEEAAHTDVHTLTSSLIYPVHAVSKGFWGTRVLQILTALYLHGVFACTSGRCNRQSEFTLLHFTIFH